MGNFEEGKLQDQNEGFKYHVSSLIYEIMNAREIEPQTAATVLALFRKKLAPEKIENGTFYQIIEKLKKIANGEKDELNVVEARIIEETLDGTKINLEG